MSIFAKVLYFMLTIHPQKNAVVFSHFQLLYFVLDRS